MFSHVTVDNRTPILRYSSINFLIGYVTSFNHLFWVYLFVHVSEIFLILLIASSSLKIKWISSTFFVFISRLPNSFWSFSSPSSNSLLILSDESFFGRKIQFSVWSFFLFLKLPMSSKISTYWGVLDWETIDAVFCVGILIVQICLKGSKDRLISIFRLVLFYY